jgi:hypothetical protein
MGALDKLTDGQFERRVLDLIRRTVDQIVESIRQREPA